MSTTETKIFQLSARRSLCSVRLDGNRRAMPCRPDANGLCVYCRGVTQPVIVPSSPGPRAALWITI